MLIRLIMVFLVLFLISSSSVAYSQDNTKAGDVKKEADEILNKVDKITTDADGLTKMADKLDTNAGDVKNRASEIKKDAGGIQTKAAAENEKVEGIKKSADAAGTDLGVLKKNADESNKSIDELKKKVDEVNDRAEKLAKYFHETITDPTYKTKWILVNMGMIALNPYSIKKKEGTDKYFLSESGTTDSHFFTEIYFKHRASWLDRDCGESRWCADGDFRIGFTSTSKDSSGAVVSGSGDAYIELSIGFPNFLIAQDLPDAKQGQSKNDTATISYNIPEFFGGLVTDKGSQSIHYYIGIGPAIVFSVPYKDNRNVEAMAGLYFGATQIPKFKNNEDSEVELKNGYPQYRDHNTIILRGDAHLPIGESGFLTANGRFNYLRNESGNINPWTVSIGYTIPTEEIFESIAKIIKQ